GEFAAGDAGADPAAPAALAAGTAESEVSGADSRRGNARAADRNPRLGVFSLQPSVLAEHQVERPAAADVWAVAPEVGERGGAVAPGVFEGVREDGQAVERPVGVDPLRERDGGCGAPVRVGSDGSERVAEDVAEQQALL